MIGKIVGHAVGEATRAVAGSEAEAKKQDPTWWWFTRGLIALTLIAGWVFILFQNKFHVDPPVVVVMLAYFAVIMTVTNLWRLGAAAVATDREDDSWGRPLGERGELEREKKTLLKAIKEAEFDLQMGKLSKADADDLISMYRARAIEVIKELERHDGGTALTPREKIEREVAARLEVDAKAANAKKKAKKGDGASKAADKTDKAADKTDKAADKTDKAADKTDKAAPASATDEPDDGAATKAGETSASDDTASPAPVTTAAASASEPESKEASS